MAVFSIGAAVLGCYIAFMLMRFAITIGMIMFMAAAAMILVAVFA